VALAVDAATMANIVAILVIFAIVIVVIAAVLGIVKGIKELKHKTLAAEIGIIIGVILLVGGYFCLDTSLYVWQHVYGLHGIFLGIVTNSAFIVTCLLLGIGLTFSMFILTLYYANKLSKLKTPVRAT
jgi:hypothetical protein